MNNNDKEYFEGVTMLKDGFLRGQYFRYPASEEASEEKGFVISDITDKAPMCLYEPCKLEQGVTLRDVFLLCNRHRDFFGLLLKRYFFEEYMDYALNAPFLKNAKQGITFDEGGYRWQRMQIDRSVTIEYGYIYPEDAVLTYSVIGREEEYSSLLHKKGEVKEESLAISYDLHGKSFPLTQDEVNSMDCPTHYKVGDEVSLGFFGCDIEKLIDIPLIVSTEVILWEHEKNGYQSAYDMRKVKSDTHIKLGDIIYAIFNEISFHGTPDQARNFEAELRESSKEADREIEKMRNTKS